MMDMGSGVGLEAGDLFLHEIVVEGTVDHRGLQILGDLHGKLLAGRPLVPGDEDDRPGTQLAGAGKLLPEGVAVPTASGGDVAGSALGALGAAGGGDGNVTHFNGTKFLMPGLGFDDDISAVFSQYNVHPFVTPTYVDDPAIISMVEHGLGISMLSELILAGKSDGVKALPIVPTVSRTLAMAVKHDKVMTMPMKRLVAITKEFAKIKR